MTDWMAAARCAGVPTDLFFPARGEENATAKLYCSACPVRKECLEHALNNHEIHGVWGGKSERARRQMRRALGIVGKPPSLDDYLFDREPAA